MANTVSDPASTTVPFVDLRPGLALLDEVLSAVRSQDLDRELELLGLAFGPYRPRPGAAIAVRREFEEWFSSFSPDGAIVVDRMGEGDQWPPSPDGRKGFYTSANGCLARWAWERVQFGEVSYAEDRLLACQMLRGGMAKV